jgi:putative ABC transport system permease protein
MNTKMLQSFWKAAWRNIIRHRIFAVINVLGLALGICFSLVIFLVVRYEFSFDHFHPGVERIYRVGRTIAIGNLASWNASRVMPALPEALRREIPGLEDVTGFFDADDMIISAPKSKKGSSVVTSFVGESDEFSETVVVSPDYFSIFPHRWLAGNARSLQIPFQVVLTARKARQYFGQLSFDKMIGRQLLLNDSIPIYLAGVVADWTGNSDFVSDQFISQSTVAGAGLNRRYSTDSWGGGRGHADIWTFVKLSPGADPKTVLSKIDQLVKAHMPKLEDPKMQLLPLSEIHFDNSYSHDDIRKAHKPTLYGVIALAGFILILAVINFVNLSTAQSVRRSREVGIRKVLGSSRAGLTLQFLMETLVVVLFAVILSALLTPAVLKVFDNFIPLGVKLTLSGPVLAFLLGMTVLTTLLAGYYPARVISSYLPVISLKGAAEYQGNHAWTMRRCLIVFQFTISLAFIVCTLVVGEQVRYMLRTDYGYKTDAILTVGTNWRDSLRKVTVLQNKFLLVPGVAAVTREIGPPLGWGHLFRPFAGAMADSMELIEMAAGDETFVPFYAMHIMAGRNLHHTDSLREVLINETAARSFGFGSPEKAVGKFLYTSVDEKRIALPIVGVVADYHTSSFHDPIRPMVIGHLPEAETYLGVKIATANRGADFIRKTLDDIQSAYKSIYPDDDFRYRFLDESIKNMYDDEQRISLLVRSAMLVTIFISCIGLFGAALFAAEKRTREVGIRKVLGAREFQLVLLLCRDFVQLVGLAILIASPIAWWAMHHWLDNFAFRIDLGIPLFLEAGLSGMIIALLTVGFQALRAARTNPVESLRGE